MALLNKMPPIELAPEALAEWGARWTGTEGSDERAKQPQRFDRKQSIHFAQVFDRAFAESLAGMLGGVPVVKPGANALTPAQPDCVEVGSTRVIGGIRPQNYDVAYRPDGPRVVFDSKTLNDEASIRKNWQNMINDLASEAATVHTRFPYCIVAFIVALPLPAVRAPQHRAIASTLNRLGSRRDELDQHHLAEAIGLVIWDPSTGEVSPPEDLTRNISLESMRQRVESCYSDRYRHLPPHTS